MRAPPIFLAAAVLVATLILALFGISALTPTNNSAATNSATPAYATPLERPTVEFGDPIRGPATARVTIVEYADYQCGPCAELEKNLARLSAEYPDDLRIVWKDFPNPTQHAEAVNAAVAARCADRQGAFWPFHDYLFSHQEDIGPGVYPSFAATLGLDENEFAACIAQNATQPLVERSFEEGQRLRIDGTPYLFVNGQRVSGSVSYEQLKTYVASALAK